MIAKDVYNIAIALPKEELKKLYDMLKCQINQDEIKLKTKKILPDFSKEDSLRYLLENLIKKPKKT